MCAFKWPCDKKCPRRHADYHSTCREYKLAGLDYAEYKENVNKIRCVEVALNSFAVESYEAAKDRRNIRMR